MSTHYDVLGLPPTATHEQIQAQYRALAKVVHPDVGGDAVMFAVLDESYEVLRDPARRAAYDASLPSASASVTQSEPAHSSGVDRSIRRSRLDGRADAAWAMARGFLLRVGVGLVSLVILSAMRACS